MFGNLLEICKQLEFYLNFWNDDTNNVNDDWDLIKIVSTQI